MECIELVKEENGIVSIGGCKLGDKPSLFCDNMSHYSVYCKHLGQDLIYCFIDVDTTRIDNPLMNEDIMDVEISCRHKQNEGIRELQLYMRDGCSFPYKTQKEFEDLAMKLANSGRFNVVYPKLHSKYNFEMICLENKKCEVEFVWNKDKQSEKNYYIEVNITPPIWTEDNIFDTEAAFIKAQRRYVLKLGKKAEDLSDYEKREVEVTVARSTLNFYDKVWGDKITKASIEYRRENLIGAGQMRTSDWDNIYKSIGMSEREVEQYRKAHEPFEAALNDSSDMYRD